MKLFKGRSYIVLFFLIMIILVLNYMHVYNMKSEPETDEFLTLRYADCYNESTTYTRLIDMSEWKYQEWMDVNVFKNTLYIEDSESLLSLSFPDAIEVLAKGRTYFGFVNIIGSINSEHNIWFRNIVIFNIFLTVLSLLMLNSLIYRMSGDKYLGLLAVMLYGASGAVVSMTVYVRFYAWLLFVCMAVIYLHYIALERDSILAIGIIMVVTGILVFLSIKNSELVLPIYALIVFSFSVSLLYLKRYKQFILYTGVIGIGGIGYLYTNTIFIKALIWPDRYLDYGKLGVVIKAVDNLSFTDIVAGIMKLSEYTRRFLFGTRVCSLFFVFLIVTALLLLFTNWKKYLSYKIVFFLSQIFMFLGYSAFILASGIYKDEHHRYYNPAYIMLTIIVVYSCKIIIEALSGKVKLRKITQSRQIIYSVYALMCLFVIYASVKTFMRRDYQDLIRGTNQFYEELGKIDDYDLLLIEDSEYHGGLYLYDAIEAAKQDTEICILKDDLNVMENILKQRKSVLIYLHDTNEKAIDKIESMNQQELNIAKIGNSKYAMAYYYTDGS